MEAVRQQQSWRAEEPRLLDYGPREHFAIPAIPMSHRPQPLGFEIGLFSAQSDS